MVGWGWWAGGQALPPLLSPLDTPSADSPLEGCRHRGIEGGGPPPPPPLERRVVGRLRPPLLSCRLLGRWGMWCAPWRMQKHMPSFSHPHPHLHLHHHHLHFRLLPPPPRRRAVAVVEVGAVGEAEAEEAARRLSFRLMVHPHHLHHLRSIPSTKDGICIFIVINGDRSSILDRSSACRHHPRQRPSPTSADEWAVTTPPVTPKRRDRGAAMGMTVGVVV